MIILVCGGRDYADKDRVFKILDKVKTERGISKIIHGAARGADNLANEWAVSRNIYAEAYPANWDLHGKKAGAIRNQLMLDAGKPDAVIAFPGGAGTADMIRRSRNASLPVWVIAA